MPGEPIAQFETLYRAHGSALLAYLSRRFGRCASPEDLLQETFVHAMRRPSQVAGAQSPRAFLFGIARHLGLSALRRRQRLVIDQPVENLDIAAPIPAADARLAELRQAIERLPDPLRATLELRLHDELSYEEISVVLKVPVGTVRSRLHNALRKLQEQFAQEDPR
jgi:RNA polymerase sigma-70 factor (ECF subfamily)